MAKIFEGGCHNQRTRLEYLDVPDVVQSLVIKL
jgi:hypothetical protein